jgi:cyclophilin family peptidyl-prolyl cis-trans isomerase
MTAMFFMVLVFVGAQVPDDVTVRCETTAGDFTIQMQRDWAPLGFDRFIELVNSNFFDDQIIYRKIPGFLIQYGVAADPEIQSLWQNNKFPDDPQKNVPFSKGTVSFAGNGVDSRSSHIFISDEPNGRGLGNAHHERPFGRIVDENGELDFIDNVSDEYGDITSLQGALVSRGNRAAAKYPNLTRFKRCYLSQLDKSEL